MQCERMAANPVYAAGENASSAPHLGAVKTACSRLCGLVNLGNRASHVLHAGAGPIVECYSKHASPIGLAIT